MISSKYDVVVKSFGISSIAASSYLSDRGIKILLIDETPISPIEEDGFVLYPYEVPMAGLSDKDYSSDMMSFIGFGDINKNIQSDREPLGIVFRESKLDFKTPYIKEDVKREFGSSQALKFNKLLEDLKRRSQRRPCSWRRGKFDRIKDLPKNIRHAFSYHGINSLYKKYDINTRLSGIMNAVLFVMSGVASRNYRLNDASRLLMVTLNGVDMTDSSIYSVRSSLLKSIRGRVDTVNAKELTDVEQGPFVIDDLDLVRRSFVEDFDRFKSEFSERVMHPVSLYAKIDQDYLSSAMPQLIIYVDADQSDYFESEDIYVVRVWAKGDQATIRVTSFVSFGFFDIYSEQHKARIAKMKSVLERLVPNMKIADTEYYPSTDNLSKCFDNLSHGDIIYDDTPIKSRAWRCGHEQNPFLGFEGLISSGVDIAHKILRKIKK